MTASGAESALLTALIAKYGRRWELLDSSGGGWIAVRRHNVSARALGRGLSNVRCGSTLTELADHLAAETDLEQRSLVMDVRPARPPQ